NALASSSADPESLKGQPRRANLLATGEVRECEELVSAPRVAKAWRSCGESRTCDVPASAALAARAPKLVFSRAEGAVAEPAGLAKERAWERDAPPSLAPFSSARSALPPLSSTQLFLG